MGLNETKITELVDLRNKRLGIREQINRTSQEIAWAAGLFEGEGSSYKTRTGVRIELSSCDEDVVDEFARIMNCGTISKRERPPYKPHWRWYTNKRDDVIEILTFLLPYLGKRRTENAQAVLEKARQISDYRK